MGQVWVSMNSNGSVQQSRHLPREYVWNIHRSRHSACLHWWPFACNKMLLERTSIYPWRDVHPPPEGWAQSQRQKILLRRRIFWLFRLSRHCDGVMPIPKKVEAIQSLAVPKTRKKLRQFIGMIKFYRDMWQKRSELLAPLTALTSQNVKYDWKDKHQRCFEAIKRVIGRVHISLQDRKSVV